MPRPIFLISIHAAILCLIMPVSPAFAKDVIADANRFTAKIITAISFPFEQESKGTVLGAGFLADRERGWILTNAHVAGRSPSLVRVGFNGHPFVKAAKVYVDNHLDVAVLKIEPASIPQHATAGELQCAAEYPPGRPVIAFGHPWSLDYTATRGIISGVKVSAGAESLQTDAALNPGNSGGPLIDAETGLIVGINKSGFKGRGAEGVHFAVPIKLVCTILDLLRQGKEPAPPAVPLLFAAPLHDGELVVAKVTGDWSQKFKTGDRVLAIDGDQSSRTLSRVLDRMRGKDRVTFIVERSGQKQEIAVEVPQEKDLMKRRGVHVSGMIIGPAVAPEAKPNKMYIHFIDDASLAEQAQLHPGDQVTSIDGILTDRYETVLNALKERRGQAAEFVVRRLRHPVQGSGSYDYLVRQLEVKDVFEVTESGIKP
jgi:serine protease Do